ncbi:hypothetical protein KP509_09G036500 [Ceratopteris richardii]|uniref:Uncharacterized protein n=1 Tax=Ceratopteris richardii TaxID=49495 RepID=A0A8T2U3F4_CERRI|nr:hypothetical protein KP509_09G036500 [Ceratopteris richardii]
MERSSFAWWASRTLDTCSRPKAFSPQTATYHISTDLGPCSYSSSSIPHASIWVCAASSCTRRWSFLQMVRFQQEQQCALFEKAMAILSRLCILTFLLSFAFAGIASSAACSLPFFWAMSLTGSAFCAAFASA